MTIMFYLQDDDGKGRNDNDLLHLSQSIPKGHAMLVLFQHRLVVLGVTWVMCKEVVQDTQTKADDPNC